MKVRTVVMLGGAAAGGLFFAATALIPIQRAPLDFSRDLADGASSSAAPTVYRETRWYELAPAGWDPYREMAEMQRAARRLTDADPRAVDMLRRVRELWSSAPTNPAMEGAAIRVPGYVVPLEKDKAGLREFLLVPYFGACIHTPAPPGQPDHRRQAAGAARERTFDGHGMGERHAQDEPVRGLSGCEQLRARGGCGGPVPSTTPMTAAYGRRHEARR